MALRVGAQVGLTMKSVKRTLSPRQAMDAGASWMVIGRPIYAAENPRASAEAILKTLS